MKVLITTSGTGSRLGSVTANTNKSLITIGSKPAISHIIDSYPTDSEFVIATGYLGNQVRHEVSRMYPTRKIDYVSIDRFVGPGSSLGFSMLQCRELLQQPFVFNACDTIVSGGISEPDQNWVASIKMKNNGQYRSLGVSNGLVTKMVDKDEPATEYIHIGLIGIYNYQEFWEAMLNAYQKNRDDQSLNDTSAISLMLGKGSKFVLKLVDRWYDTGNPESLSLTLNLFSKK